MRLFTSASELVFRTRILTRILTTAILTRTDILTRIRMLTPTMGIPMVSIWVAAGAVGVAGAMGIADTTADTDTWAMAVAMLGAAGSMAAASTVVVTGVDTGN